MTLLQADSPEIPEKEKQPFLNKIFKILKNKWIRIGLSVLIIGFAIYYLVDQFTNLKILLSERSPSVGLLSLSSMFILIAVIVGIFTWKWILRGFGFNLSWGKATRIHLVSILAKYIPGFVWQFSGKAYMAHGEGIPLSIAIAAMSMEVGVSLLSGIGITLLLTPLLQFTRIPLDMALIHGLQIIGIALMVLVFLSPFLMKRLFLKQIIEHKVRVCLQFWYMATVAMLLGWGLLAGAFLISTISFGFDGLGFLSSLLTVCGSTTSGILVIFVPNGLVVREAVIMKLLPIGFDQIVGLMLSLISRLQVVISELVVSGIFFGFRFIKNKYKKHFEQE